MEVNGGSLMLIEAHNSAISSCNFLDDTKIITSSHDKTLKIWEISTRKKLSELTDHDNCVSACSINKKTKNIFSGSWDRAVIFWDLETCKPLWKGRHSTLVTGCDLHPTSHLAVSGCDSGRWGYWDTRNGERLKKMDGHSDTVTSCKFSFNGLNICTTSMDNTACVWDVRTNKCLITLRDHTNVVTSCTFSNADSYLATTSWDKTVRLYDIAIGSFRSTGAIVLKHHEGCVSSSCFSTDDSLLVSCGCDKLISVWNTVTAKKQNSYKGHKSWIYCCQISESGEWIASGSKDGELRLWNTKARDLCERKLPRNKDPFEQLRCYECGLAYTTDNSEDYNTDIVIGQCILCRLKKNE